MRQKTDVFVIGGGPAGLAAAIAARRKGFDVLVADGGSPPIDKACGEGLLPDTLAALQGLGITIRETDGFEMHGIRFLNEGSSVGADFLTGKGMGVRRSVLHNRMMERAQECGIRFIWNAPASGIFGERAIVGGSDVVARWIIGADGGRSRVRKWSGLEDYTQRLQRFAYRQHFSVEPWTSHAEIYWGKNRQVYVTPIGKKEVCVAVISDRRDDRVGTVLAEFPALARRIASAAPTSTERGAMTGMHQLKRIHSGNVALVGDASGGVDAITGEGLGLGFRQAMALAEALEKNDLRRYQEEHARLSRRPLLMGSLMLLLGRKEKLRKSLIATLQAAPGVFARMLAVHVGAASPRQIVTASVRLGWRLLTA